MKLGEENISSVHEMKLHKQMCAIKRTHFTSNAEL